MRRWIALLLCSLTTASLPPSQAWAQVARSARAAPVLPATPVLPKTSLPAASLSPSALPGTSLPAPSVSGQLEGIARAKDPAPLWTGDRVRAAAAAIEVPAIGPSGPILLQAPGAAAANAVSEPSSSRERIALPRQSLGRRLRDAVHYAKITGSSLWWYTFPRLVERWDELAEALDRTSSRRRAVRRPMAFFIAHRVLGSTGSYAPMGFRVAANRVVVDDARRIYASYFPKDAASREAFERLVTRAAAFNPQRRSTQFRKIIFHALREAATLRPEELPAFFDSLATLEKSAALAGYQAGPQKDVLERFEALTQEVILDLNRGLPRGKRVVGAVLLGSFANGAAGPGSDLDVQALSEDGGTAHNAEFLKRLKSRWKEAGYPDHPVSGFEYALPLSKPLLRRIHREPYLVVSPYPEVTAGLSTAPEELAALGTKRTLRGLAFVWFYSAVLLSVLSVYEGWRRATRRR